MRSSRVVRALSVALVLAVSACARESRPPQARTADDFGDTLSAGTAPRRIVSLNPSTTELLFAIGAGNRLVGRTTYDLWPVAARSVPDLGPGLRPNVEAVLAVHPDLVVLYASDDNRDAARRLRAAGVATAAFRVDRVAHGLADQGHGWGDRPTAQEVSRWRSAE